MSLSRLPLVSCLALALATQIMPAFAQNAVLTGSINHNDYRSNILTQDATISQMVPTEPYPMAAPTALPQRSRPVTSVRIPQAAPQQARISSMSQPTRLSPMPQQARLSPRVEYVDRPVVKTVYVQDNRTFFQKHPKVKAATIGAGVGAGVGALTGLVTHRGVMRGALIGAGAGAGVGLVRSSVIMKRHPIMRNVATGSLIGLGLGAAASRGHRKPLIGTGIGAAVGLGASLLNGEFR
jgi:hypothetical protein